MIAAAMAGVIPAAAAGQGAAAVVRLDGRPLLRLAVDSEPDPRAREVERRPRALVEQAEAPPPTRVMPARGDTVAIFAGSTKIVGVSSDDAEENLLPKDSLARRWSLAIDSAIAAARAAPARSHGRELGPACGVLHGLGHRLLLALETVGVPVQTLIAGLGLTSLAPGFALREVISNFISGLLLLVLRPFALGDEIVVGETEGRVERIELRATELRTYDGRMVVVPNAELFTSVVTNNTASPMRRGELRCPIDYGDDIRGVVEQLRRSAESVPAVARHPPVAVRLQEFGANEIWVRVTFWTDSRAVDLATARDAVAVALLEGLARGGYALLGPQRRRAMPGLGLDADPGSTGNAAGSGDAVTQRRFKKG